MLDNVVDLLNYKSYKKQRPVSELLEQASRLSQLLESYQHLSLDEKKWVLTETKILLHEVTVQLNLPKDYKWPIL